jgi:hypothetical protein
MSLFTESNAIRSLGEVYSNWQQDSDLLKGSIRICDIKWVSLAHYLVKFTKNYFYFDRQHCSETMAEWQPLIHEKFYRPLPILRMSLDHLFACLSGLEWYALCEMYDKRPRDRGSPEWLERVKHTLELLRYRAYFFACHELSSSVLDIEDYTYTKKEMREIKAQRLAAETGVEDVDCLGYFSDEEQRQQYSKRQKLSSSNSEKNDILRRLDALEGSVGTLDDRSTMVNINYAFDMNTIFQRFDLSIRMYEHEFSKIPMGSEEVELSSFMFRQHLNDRFKNLKNTTLLSKKWQFDLQCLSSQRLVYLRKAGKMEDDGVSSEQVIMNRLMGLVEENVMHEMCEYLTPPVGVDSDVWKKVQTDALFSVYSSILPDGDIYRWLFRTEEDVIMENVAAHYIFRIRMSNKWCLHDHGTRTLYTSFTKAFLVLRTRMLARNESPHIRKILHGNEPQKRMVLVTDLSQFDMQFGLITTKKEKE